MASMPKKSSMALLLALGGPKSKNPDGASGSSISSPDQSGDAMAPGMSDDATDSPQMASDASEQGEDVLDIPKGFKPPSSAADGGMFTTTIRAMVQDGKLKVLAIGDMPIHPDGSMAPDAMDDDSSAAPSDEQPDQSQQPALSDEGAAMVKKRKDETAAKNVFQKGR